MQLHGGHIFLFPIINSNLNIIFFDIFQLVLVASSYNLSSNCNLENLG
jgi:hypothetical protein